MFVNKIGKSEPYVPFVESTDSLILGIEGNQIIVNLAAKEKDTQEVINIMQTNEGTLVEGLENGLFYAAVIIIPPRAYDWKKSDVPVIDIDPETGEERETWPIVPVPRPFNIDAAELQLFTLERPLEEPEHDTTSSNNLGAEE